MTHWLFQIGGMLFIGYGAYSLTVGSDSTKDRLWLNGLLVVLGLSALRALTLGSASDPDCDPDPVYGGCSSVQLFEPSVELRSHAAVTTFLWLLIPIGVGVWLGLVIREKRRRNMSSPD